jgi:hypothetical protein
LANARLGSAELRLQGMFLGTDFCRAISINPLTSALAGRASPDGGQATPPPMMGMSHGIRFGLGAASAFLAEPMPTQKICSFNR